MSTSQSVVVVFYTHCTPSCWILGKSLCSSSLKQGDNKDCNWFFCQIQVLTPAAPSFDKAASEPQPLVDLRLTIEDVGQSWSHAGGHVPLEAIGQESELSCSCFCRRKALKNKKVDSVHNLAGKLQPRIYTLMSMSFLYFSPYLAKACIPGAEDGNYPIPGF